ncbi:hypothetical protein D4764_15G0008460 [Takifugu flavidus]|uniref:Uncharacterized protein n=1 Tax=Takifugu flavidus TaxID=433684 RepID=A0A5C6P0X0_9TELE|nr:hypothetical protein D4764_15G0008460 [Takifugu flavidus]
MEEPAVQQEKIEGMWEGGQNGGKADWKNERSLSSFLKHSCFLCWSSSKETDAVETDERVITKAAEIRELGNALAMEKLDLQEQQSDRLELEETLVKMETQKEKLIQQIKTIRQLCYNESQQILSLQADEMQKESQVEEYERELARARWRLKKLREEVKQAKRKVDEAGERNDPLQESIRESYEEILQGYPPADGQLGRERREGGGQVEDRIGRRGAERRGEERRGEERRGEERRGEERHRA